MKIDDIALLAAAAAAVFLVMKAKNGGALSWTPWKKVATYDGYQYYNDGTSGLVITPDGSYVLNGETVWAPDARTLA